MIDSRGAGTTFGCCPSREGCQRLTGHHHRRSGLKHVQSQPGPECAVVVSVAFGWPCMVALLSVDRFQTLSVLPISCEACPDTMTRDDGLDDRVCDNGDPNHLTKLAEVGWGGDLQRETPGPWPTPTGKGILFPAPNYTFFSLLLFSVPDTLRRDCNMSGERHSACWLLLGRSPRALWFCKAPAYPRRVSHVDAALEHGGIDLACTFSTGYGPEVQPSFYNFLPVALKPV